MTKTMTEYSSVGDNLEDVTESDLEKESLIRKPDLVIEYFMVSASYVKYENKIDPKYLSKIWRVD